MAFGKPLTDQHRHCDELFARFEERAGEGDFAGARRAFDAFILPFERHLQLEEETLFPALEAKLGGPLGPTAVMRMEHGQMREILTSMLGALDAKSVEDCLGHSETLLMVMQQHNLKEERMLYPMMDRALGAEAASLLGPVARS